MQRLDMASPYALNTASLTDALYASLRQRIIDGDLAPGEKLTELRVSSEYAVARPTAKACLERLTAAGLLRRSAHKTAIVPMLTAEELVDLFMAREAVERTAVEQLALTRYVPEEAHRASEDQNRAATSHDFRRQVAADVAFHTALVNGTGSPRLAKMHELIMGEVHLTMGQYQAHKSAAPDTVVHEHESIIEAIEAGDAEEAQKQVREHLQHARERLIARLEADKKDE